MIRRSFDPSRPFSLGTDLARDPRFSTFAYLSKGNRLHGERPTAWEALLSLWTSVCVLVRYISRCVRLLAGLVGRSGNLSPTIASSFQCVSPRETIDIWFHPILAGDDGRLSLAGGFWENLYLANFRFAGKWAAANAWTTVNWPINSIIIIVW